MILIIAPSFPRKGTISAELDADQAGACPPRNAGPTRVVCRPSDGALRIRSIDGRQPVSRAAA
jgi:hypothetical protein